MTRVREDPDRTVMRDRSDPNSAEATAARHRPCNRVHNLQDLRDPSVPDGNGRRDLHLVRDGDRRRHDGDRGGSNTSQSRPIRRSPTKMVPTAELPNTCRGCGAHVGPNAAYCLACGTSTGQPPTPVAATPSAPPGGKSNTRTFLLAGGVGLIIGAVLIGGWFLLQRSESGGEDSTASATSDTSSSQNAANTDSAAAANASDPDTGTICWSLGAQGVDATRSLAEAFETVSTRELGGMARTSRTALPGATRFDAEWSAITAETRANDCEAEGVEAAYSTEMASQTPPTGTQAALVWSAGDNLAETQADPLTQVAASFRLYPAHTPIVPSAAAEDSDLPQWVVMLSSLNTAETTRSAADARAASFTSQGIPASVLLSDNFASLTPGYWAVHAGPFPDRVTANDYCKSIKSTVPDCYQRYVQVLPSTDVPFGQCGPYGMIDVTGVDPGNSLPVLSRPEDGRAEVVRLPSSASGILVAGPPETSTGSWTPVAVTGTIGWVKTQYTIDNATCPRTAPAASGVSCSQVAAATIDLFREISNVAAAASDSGALNSVAPGQHDQAAANLVSQAAASRCTATELNAMLIASRSTIVPANTFAALTVDTLYATPFFRDA